MTAQARTVAFATAAILAVLLLGAGVLIGRGSVSSAQRSSTTNPIALVNGVPVGVADTPAGAIAANDNYLATEAQTDEQDQRCSRRSSRPSSPRHGPAVTPRGGPTSQQRHNAHERLRRWC